jgi:hypothetical protein
MAAVGRSLAWRAALLQCLTLAAVALVLAAMLDRAFFVDWGWLAGPGAWAACSLATGLLLCLPPLPVLVGAAVAGLPGVIAVLLGVHWLGAPIGVALFAWWCQRLGDRRSRATVAAAA